MLARRFHWSERLRCRTGRPTRISPRLHAAPRDDQEPSTSGPTAETGAALKAVWYAAEGLGKVVGMSKGSSTNSSSPNSDAALGIDGKLSWERLVQLLRDDYSQNYFISGKGDLLAYADDAEFADPFVSFRGKSRFQQNVGNLGGMMRDVKLDVYDWQEQPDKLQVVTRWRFSCTLTLPWRPLLAAAGSTTHVVDPVTGLVTKHVEAWDVDPKRVVGQLFRPAAKVPTTAAETFFLSASDGDFMGMWFAVAPLCIKLSLPVVVVSLLCKLITGEGLPGVTLGAIEGVSYLALVSACITEVVKFAQGMQGGETGTGGRF